MDGLQIAYLLSLDKYTSRYFKGYGMRDTPVLPSPKSKSALYILNTDKSSGPGEHWCAAFFDDCKGEFFDPFGMPPHTYNFPNLLETQSVGNILYNNIMVQDLESDACGFHCIFYSHFRCRGYSMKEILNMYNYKNLKRNDEMVIEFVKKFGKVYWPIKML